MYFFRLVLAYICLFISTTTCAQNVVDSLNTLLRINRDIDKTKSTIVLLFNKADSLNISGGNSASNDCNITTTAKQISDLQNNIEKDSLLNRDKKIAYLEGLNNSMIAFKADYSLGKLTFCQLPVLIKAWRRVMDLDRNNLSISPVITENEPGIGMIIINSFPIEDKQELNECQSILILQSYEKNADALMPLLFKFPDVSIADSLLIIAARTQPERLYTYSQAINRPLGKRIQNNPDKLVQLIMALAQMKEGRMYFPFLDDLYKGKISQAAIKNTIGETNKTLYYKLLVQTQIRYTERMQRKDTPLAYNALMEMLKLIAVDNYINTINGLHERPDVIRLQVLHSLNAQDLYYLCVAGDNLLFTSSYLKIYNLIFTGQRSPYAFALLNSVHFDHYKRFIKMASTYNTLDDFLQKMEHKEADSLMKSFVGGLQDPLSIEDAVDVADSYAAITNTQLRKTILTEVQRNLSLASVSGNDAGKTIYSLLNSIFLSLDTSNNIDISTMFGIPAVYQLNNCILRDSAGIINIQQFFYGDEDGQHEFNNFLLAYKNPNWKIIQKKNWIEIHSVKGVNTVIYSNKPLDEKKHLDSTARVDLHKYLELNNIHPAIIIHRGHSYYAKYTIQKIPQSAKLVFLGSCGGYNNLSQVLKISPYAHIISTKQAGTGSINQPIIVYLTELLRQDKNLNWPLMWKVLAQKFKYNKDFEDYIPPHQNLGAIFIMAYYEAIEKKD
jgi:hypothetical protein